MPESAAEIVLRAGQLFSRSFGDGDAEAEAEMRSLFAPEPLIVPFRAALEGTEYSGPSAVEEFITDSRESWATLRFHPTEVEATDEKTVVVAGDLVGTGHETGAETQAKVALVFVVRDGLIHEMRTFLSKREALAAVSR